MASSIIATDADSRSQLHSADWNAQVARVRGLIAMQYPVTGDSAMVVSVPISRGRTSRETFMKDLAGLPVVYSGDPLLPHPALSQWLESRVAGGQAVAVRPQVVPAQGCPD